MAEIDHRKERLDYLKDLQSHFLTYHNHKENLAWAGVVLYLTLLAGIAASLKGHLFDGSLSYVERLALSLFVGAGAALIWFYVTTQFWLRTLAAHHVAACMEMRSSIVAQDVPDASSNWKPKGISRSATLADVLPIVMVEKVKMIAALDGGIRAKLERTAGAIFALITMAFFASIWFF